MTVLAQSGDIMETAPIFLMTLSIVPPPIQTDQAAGYFWEEVAIVHLAHFGLDVEAIENFGNGF